MNSNQTSEVIVTLLHGTWGRGVFAPKVPPQITQLDGTTKKGPSKFWFYASSTFCRSLCEKLHSANIKVVFFSFIWSGANSIFERERAAKKLAEHMTDIAVRYPSRRHVLIAHSHGGNIAIRATTLFRSLSSQVNLVTLATPFLRIIEVPSVAGLGWIIFTLMVCFMWMFVIPVYKFFLVSGFPLWPMESTDAPEDIALGAVLVLLPANLIISAILCATIVDFFINPWKPKGYRWPWRKKPTLLAETTQGAIGVDVNLLIVRAFNDEAAMALTLGTIGNKLTYFMLYFIVVIVGLSDFVDADLWLPPILLSIYGFAYIFAFITLPLVLIVSAGVFKSVFGRELLFGAYRCDIAADSTPDISSNIKNVKIATLSSRTPRSEGFRHGLHARPDCAPTIADWIVSMNMVQHSAT